MQRNGRLEFSIAPAVEHQTNPNWGGGGAVGVHYGTLCNLTGDFDARIDFKLLQWPIGDGVALSLGVYFPPPNEASWGVQRSGGGAAGPEGYSSWIDNAVGVARSQDRRGTLRLARQNDVLTAYFRSRGHWTSLGSGPAPGPTRLILMLSTHPNTFANMAASAAFDNLRATATSVQCPPGTPLPPRRVGR